VPKLPLFDFLDTHVGRKDCQKVMKTCFVDKRNNWTGKPPYQYVIILLMDTIKNNQLLLGENRYAIPHHLFQESIKCRQFSDCEPFSGPKNGDFAIYIVKVDPASRGGIIDSLQPYENMNAFEQYKVRKTILKYSKKQKNLRLLIARHIHPCPA
jgi:hypothetical protein